MKLLRWLFRMKQEELGVRSWQGYEVNSWYTLLSELKAKKVLD